MMCIFIWWAGQDSVTSRYSPQAKLSSNFVSATPAAISCSKKSLKFRIGESLLFSPLSKVKEHIKRYVLLLVGRFGILFELLITSPISLDTTQLIYPFSKRLRS
jgi:hypothetical protein